MHISYTVTIKSAKEWREKMQGVILVDTPSNRDKVLSLLSAYDSSWLNNPHLIRFGLNEIADKNHIRRNCNYTYKTTIPDNFIQEMKDMGIDIFIYQYQPETD